MTQLKYIVTALLLLLAGSTAARSRSISMEELRDKIAGAWIGQMVGNIYGCLSRTSSSASPAAKPTSPTATRRTSPSWRSTTALSPTTTPTSSISTSP